MTLRKLTVAALAVASVSMFSFAQQPSPQPSTQPATQPNKDGAARSAPKKQYDKPPEMNLDLAKTYTATITTSKGKIVLELFAKEAPQTVNSFVFLAREGFYDGLIFHRVIPNFMIQGGDPTGTGAGGPGYKYQNENQYSEHAFTPGTLAMANAGPNTNGSQFFIIDTTVPHLTADAYTIFGEVKEGLDVVKEIARVQTARGNRPVEEVKMEKVEIEEK